MAIVTDARTLKYGQTVYVKALNGSLHPARVVDFNMDLLGMPGNVQTRETFEYYLSSPILSEEAKLQYIRNVFVAFCEFSSHGTCFEYTRTNADDSEPTIIHFHDAINGYPTCIDLWGGIVYDSPDDGPPAINDGGEYVLYPDGTTKPICDKEAGDPRTPAPIPDSLRVVDFSDIQIPRQRDLTAEEIQAVISSTPTDYWDAIKSEEIWQCSICRRVYGAYRSPNYGQPSVGCCEGKPWVRQISLSTTPHKYEK